MNYQVHDIENLPLVVDKIQHHHVEELVENSIELSREGWDSYETSWDFKRNPLV